MRLDKFLKISLIFKTRSSGEKAIIQGKVTVNGRPAKPAASVKENDILSVSTPFKRTGYRILKIFEKSVSKKDAQEMYEITGEEKIEF